MMVRPHSFLFLFFACQLAVAQTEVEPPSHHVGVDVHFNNNDVFLGASFYLADPFGEEYAIMFSAYGRPYGKKVLIKESAGVYSILREHRYLALIGVERQFLLTSDLSAFVDLLGGMSMIFYRGSNRDHVEATFPVINAGLSFALPEGEYFKYDWFLLRAGYQYINLPSYEHRIYFGVLVSI